MVDDTFDWSKFHKFADDILEGFPPEDKELCFRVAIGRYYYASYNLLKKFAINKFKYQPHRNSEDHGALTDFLSHIACDNECLTACNKLRKLRTYRNNCDYEEIVENIESVCRYARKNSEYILDYLSKNNCATI